MNTDIRNFFERHILPLHKKSATDKSRYLDIEFRSSAPTYFSSPKHPDCLYLNTIQMANDTELQVYLNDFWQDEPELLELIPNFTKLVFQLKEEYREQSAELSPFVYAMF